MKIFLLQRGENPVGCMPATFFFLQQFFFFSLGTSNPTPTQLALVVGEGGRGPGKSTHRNFDFGNFFSFGPAHHLLRWSNGVWGRALPPPPPPSSSYQFRVLPTDPHFILVRDFFPSSWDRRVSIKRKKGQSTVLSPLPWAKKSRDTEIWIKTEIEGGKAFVSKKGQGSFPNLFFFPSLFWKGKSVFPLRHQSSCSIVLFFLSPSLALNYCPVFSPGKKFPPAVILKGNPFFCHPPLPTIVFPRRKLGLN